jgi:hypothetical protein
MRRCPLVDFSYRKEMAALTLLPPHVQVMKLMEFVPTKEEIDLIVDYPEEKYTHQLHVALGQFVGSW